MLVGVLGLLAVFFARNHWCEKYGGDLPDIQDAGAAVDPLQELPSIGEGSTFHEGDMEDVELSIDGEETSVLRVDLNAI